MTKTPRSGWINVSEKGGTYGQYQYFCRDIREQEQTAAQANNQTQTRDPQTLFNDAAKEIAVNFTATT